MEFNKLATAKHHDNGAECNILDPISGKPTDFFIKICGADSKVWRKQKKIQTRKLLSVRSQSTDEDFDYEEAGIDFEAMDIEALVIATIGWRGLVDNGKEVKFSKEIAHELFDNSPSIVRQLIEFLGNGENFTSD
tara:strand:+ start:259 stop:663 length:405 start_codon:yes stop_codon:yes gene_type:complete